MASNKSASYVNDSSLQVILVREGNEWSKEIPLIYFKMENILKCRWRLYAEWRVSIRDFKPSGAGEMGHGRQLM